MRRSLPPLFFVIHDFDYSRTSSGISRAAKNGEKEVVEPSLLSTLAEVKQDKNYELQKRRARHEGLSISQQRWSIA